MDSLLGSRIACLGYEGFPRRFLLIAMIGPNHPINMLKQDTAHFSFPNLGTQDAH